MRGKGRVRRLPLLSLATALAGMAGAARAQTVIVADTDVARTLDTVVAPNGTTYTIDGGRLAGTNLFHSFTHFTLGSGDLAQWVRSGGNAGAISNVINRVTGGDPSQIEGTIDSTALPNADFYFINPAGIVFGAGAQVNVPAAAHFSTAGELRFADGATFSIAAPDGSTLSVAAPESFGFVGGQGGVGIFDASDTFVAPGASLTISAADILIEDSGFSTAGLDLAAVGSGQSQVVIGDSLSAPAAGFFTVAGSTIAITPAGGEGRGAQIVAGDALIQDTTIEVESTDERAGAFSLSADILQLVNSNVGTSGIGAADTSPVSILAGVATLENSIVASAVQGSGDGSDVTIVADQLFVNGGILGTAALGDGAAGNFSIVAGETFISGGAQIFSTVLGAGDGGNVSIVSDVLDASNSFVVTTSSGLGLPGGVEIEGRQILLSGMEVGAITTTDAPGGDVNISASESLFAEGSFLTTTSSGGGPGGDLFLSAPDMLLADTTISSDTLSGLGGSVFIDSTDLFAQDVFISSDTVGEGNAGSVTIAASTFEAQGARVSSDSFGSGGGGLVTLIADQLTLGGGSAVSSDNSAEGEGGLILLQAGELLIDGSEITTDAFDVASGRAGFINIAADLITLSNGAKISSDTFFSTTSEGGIITIDSNVLRLESFSAISSDASGLGPGGAIIIDSGLVALSDSSISSNTDGEGAGGFVSLSGGDLVLDRSTVEANAQFGSTGDAGLIGIFAENSLSAFDSEISVDSDSFGAAGGIVIQAPEVILDGTSIKSEVDFALGTNGFVGIEGDRLIATNGSEISSNSLGSANAGLVVLTVGDIRLEDSVVATDTFGSGAAGSVSIASDDLLVQGNGFVSSDSLGEGNAGGVFIETGDLTVRDSAFISSQAFSSGDAGEVSIVADNVVVADLGEITTQTQAGSTGAAGVLDISANSLRVSGGGNISSDTQGAGNAGIVSIQAGTVLVEEDSFIRSRARAGSTGNAGLVEVSATSLEVRSGGVVSSNTSSVGDAGTVLVDAQDVLVDGGQITSSAALGSEGSSGDVSIVADEVSVLNGGSIQTASANTNPAGQVDIAANTIAVDGAGSSISSENTSDAGGDAGSVFIETLGADATGITLSEGGGISTSSAQGSAGNISLAMAPQTFLFLEGETAPGVIETSSGPGTGGVISIASPLAIISNGGRIEALGESGGANVQIQSQFFISSADRLNVVAVDGVFLLEAQVDDVSSGTSSREVSVLDASKVLRGQCPAARSTGQISQLTIRPVGPYAPPGRDIFDAPLPATPSNPLGGCL